MTKSLKLIPEVYELRYKSWEIFLVSFEALVLRLQRSSSPGRSVYTHKYLCLIIDYRAVGRPLVFRA